MAISRQPAQGSSIGQLLLGASFEPCPFAEVGDVDKCPSSPGHLDASCIVLAKALDHAQAHTDRRLRPGNGFKAAIPVTGAHIHRANL